MLVVEDLDPFEDGLGELSPGAPAPGSGFHLASLPLSDGRRAQLVVHAEPIGDRLERLDELRRQAQAQIEAAGVDVPEGGYYYFFGHHADGARFIMRARARADD